MREEMYRKQVYTTVGQARPVWKPPGQHQEGQAGPWARWYPLSPSGKPQLCSRPFRGPKQVHLGYLGDLHHLESHL